MIRMTKCGKDGSRVIADLISNFGDFSVRYMLVEERIDEMLLYSVILEKLDCDEHTLLESAEALQITSSKNEAFEFYDKLRRCSVTPVSLEYIVEDM